MTEQTIKAGVVGGTGYTGGEALRLLLGHPSVDVVETTSRSHAGKAVSEIHPNLKGATDLFFQEEHLERLNEKTDVLFFGLPHGVSMEKIAELDLDQTRVLDLGADFRLDDAEQFKRVYDEPHAAPELLSKARYGLTEFNREQLQDAKLVACPGCFPTGALLAILPLLSTGLVEPEVIIDSKTGSSGSGRTASPATHHPERAVDFRAYKIFRHRHADEIRQEGEKQEEENSLNVTFTPHSAPIIRGIFTTAYLHLSKPADEQEIQNVYRRQYQDEPFIRLVDRPRSTVVRNTNYADLAVHVEGKRVIVLSAIDNLLKGAAGQGVQNMNVMFDLPENEGLEFSGTHP